MTINQYTLVFTLLLMIVSTTSHAIDVVSPTGDFQSKLFGGKIYDDRGNYTGMITAEGKMYDKDGKFTGQIKNQSILDRDGSYRGVIRGGKVYDKDGLYEGQLKR